jgi:hypothetical protein
MTTALVVGWGLTYPDNIVRIYLVLPIRGFWMAWGTVALTVAYAVRELDSSRRLGAQTTFFRLGEDPGLARFIDSMAQRVEGRVVAPELDDLGAAVVGSYLGSRSASGSSMPYRGGYGDWFGGRGFWVGD